MKEVGDCKRPGRHTMLASNGHITKTSLIVHNDCYASTTILPDMVNIDRDRVWQLLHDQVNMAEVCMQMVPKLFAPEQNKTHEHLL